MSPSESDAYIELGKLLEPTDAMGAVNIYSRYPFAPISTGESDPDVQDDAFLHTDIVHLLMKSQAYDDPRLEEHLIALGRINTYSFLDKWVKTLEGKFKYKVLMRVHANVYGKTVDDDDEQAFFKVKMWM